MEKELPPLSARARMREFGADMIARDIKLLLEQKGLPNPTVDLDRLRAQIIRRCKLGRYDIASIMERVRR